MTTQEHILQVRLLVAVPRSGSTLLMRIFREAPSCSVTTSGLVWQGNSEGASFKPDYTIFTSPTSHKVYQEALLKGSRTLVSKEEFGHSREKGECDYVIIPDAAAYRVTKPAFLFRDPIRVFDSWKALGWSDIESFAICYTSLHNMHKDHPECHALTYEDLVSNPEETIRSVCEYLDIDFTMDMLSFKHSLTDFLFNSEREKSVYSDESPATSGIFHTVQSYSSVQQQIPSHGLLSISEVEFIESALGKLYVDVCGPRVEKMRNLLREKVWFAFDLDDTLHEFGKASSAAAAGVFQYLHVAHHIAVDDLSSTYSTILSQKTSSAFTDGRTSAEYRKERFSALLESHTLASDEVTLDHLAGLYGDVLEKSLQLKPGALHLLQHLRVLGKKIMIITEGPFDAQQWTITALDITPYVDILVTTNDMGKSKIDGLFGAVLQKFGIKPDDMIFIGDSAARDVAPARVEGIWSWLYDEKNNCKFEVEAPRINSLLKMKHILGRV